MSKTPSPLSEPHAPEVGKQLDAICNRFEAACRGSILPRIEDFLSTIPDGLSRTVLLRELIHLDVHYRRTKGEIPRFDDYEKRFPDIETTWLKELLPSQGLDNYETIDNDTNRASNETPDDPAFIQTLARYKVLKTLGKGAFGVVYLAQDEQLQRRVAIKVPHRKFVARAGAAEAYLTEARTVANLDHPNIVPVYDVGSTDGCPCFIVSKFVEGGALSDRIESGRPSFRDAAELVATVADALHYAHRIGLVHRDIKPGNILVDTGGKPFVVDFGLALKEADIGKGSNYAGTPAYMSPEQARGEGHRVDGRSDIFSLGVVLYELLTSRRPFHADSRDDLMEQIMTHEARPPRQWDETIPKELERICLRSLSKRASDRYTAAKDMADDLRHFLAQQPSDQAKRHDLPASPPVVQPPSTLAAAGPAAQPKTPLSDSRPIRIVPKGLRSFDALDADFFLELLPGPRDRDGLPESIRFWKTRIEETDPDNTFTVGLLYGPSGCGKSSLVKAGLLPRLSGNILKVYVEATAEETETRLLNGLRKRCPALAANGSLPSTLGALRRGQSVPAGKKILIVLDQFEQWLHAKKDQQTTELVQALRQCDGARLQTIVMVRDDFWMAATRFIRELEVRLVDGHNFAAVDLFPVRHAEKVLASFGRAFGCLPEKAGEVSNEQFLEKAIAGLAQEGKVVSVRLALFAEMMKGKEWSTATLKAVGGAEGFGVTFLEETFSAANAPPEHRYHQKAARAILKALLPKSGADIRGQMRSRDELLEASGYKSRLKDFDDLLRILDREIRLLTPTDPEGKDEGERMKDEKGKPMVASSDSSFIPPPSSLRFYQLTHDYLVHSLRAWLTRKQKETRRGRAELLLEDRAGAWNARPENRQLPSLLQWVSIRSLTQEKNWTGPQKKMMRRAGGYHSIRGMALAVACAAVGALVIGSVIAIQLGHEQEKTKVVLGLAEELSSRMVMERGLALCEQGQAGRGLLWMSHSLKIAPEKADLQQDIRANLAAWHRQVHPLKAVLPHRRQVLAVAFSPDGKTIVTGDIAGTARLWDVATGQPVPITLRHEKAIWGVAFSPDGKTIVTGSLDHSARLWEAATGKLLRELPHAHAVMGVAFSPDGKLVATACNEGAPRLWDVTTAEARELPTAGGPVAFSPDGKSLAMAADVPFWDVATGKPRATGSIYHGEVIWTLAFSPDGKTIVTGSSDKTARLWDVAAGKSLGITLPHKAAVRGVAFSPDGETVVTGSGDGVAQLWDRRTGQRRGAPLPHRDAVLAVAFSRDGKTLATGGLDNTVRLWDVGTTKQPAILLPHPREVKVAAFSPDSKIVLTGSSDSIQPAQFWDAVTGMPIGPPLRQNRPVVSAAFSPNGETVVLTDFWSAQRWDVATSQPIGGRMVPPKRIAVGWAVAFSPDSKTILHGTSDWRAYLWDAATGKLVGEPLPHEDSVEAVAFSPDGKIMLTGSLDTMAKLWDGTTRKLLNTLHHQGGVMTVTFSPDSSTVLTGGQDGTARLWDAAMGKPLGTPMQHTGIVNRAIFSPDGKTILTGSGDGTARLWQTATQKPIGAPLAHQGALRAVAFCPDGKTVVTGSDDGTAQLWDAATGKRLGTPLQHQGPVYAVAFSLDGNTILTGSQDGNGRLWQLPPPVPGGAEQIVRWTQVITGMELDADSVVRVLDGPTWHERRQELEKTGGPPVPWSTDPAAAKREQALRARQEDFDRAARLKQ